MRRSEACAACTITTTIGRACPRRRRACVAVARAVRSGTEASGAGSPGPSSSSCNGDVATRDGRGTPELGPARHFLPQGARQARGALRHSAPRDVVVTKAQALGVPASTTNSPTGSQGKFGSMSSLNSRQLSPRASIISNMTWSDHSSQRSAGSYDRPASPLTTVKT